MPRSKAKQFYVPPENVLPKEEFEFVDRKYMEYKKAMQSIKQLFIAEAKFKSSSLSKGASDKEHDRSRLLANLENNE